MKKSIRLALIAVIATGLTACEIIGDIFQAGMYWGIFLVVAFIVLVIYLVNKVRRKG
jgi:hypothetical protein